MSRKLTTFLLALVFVAIYAGIALADNGKFYGTYSIQYTVAEDCDSGFATHAIGNDYNQRGSYYTYLPQAGTSVNYTYNEKNETRVVTVTIVSDTTIISEEVAYENGKFDWSQSVTFSFSADFNTISFSGEVVDYKPGECFGPLSGTGTRIASGTHMAYIPHMTGGYPDWDDYLQADNLSTSQASYTLTLYGADGAVIYSGDQSVAGLSKTTFLLKGLNSATRSAAAGKITYTESKLNFRLSYRYVPGGGVAEFKLTDTLSSKLGFFFSDFMHTLDTRGVALTNFGTTAANVTLEAIGNGSVNGTIDVTIEPNQKLIAVYQELFNLDMSQVQTIRATSSSPTLSGIVITSEPGLDFLLFTAAEPIN